MADLAEDPSPALVRGVGPVIRRQRARVDPEKHELGSRRPPKPVAHGDRHGREAAVEADLEKGGRAVAGRDHPVDLLAVEAQRLLHQHRLARFQGAGRQFGVAVVAGGDENGIDIGVFQDRRRVGAGMGEAEGLPAFLGGRAAPGDHGVKTDAGHFLQFRQEHGAGKVAGPDDPENAPGGVCRRRRKGRARRPCAGRRGVRRSAAVGQHHAQVGLVGAGDHGVGRLRLVQGEAVADQRRHVEPPGEGGRHQAHGLGQVLRFRPAHEADRILHAAAFEVFVVAPRAVGARDHQAQLFLHEFPARKRGPRGAHHAHPRPVAGDGRGGGQGFAGVGGGGDEDAVAPHSGGQRRDRLLDAAAGQVEGGLGAHAPGQVQAPGIVVQGHGPGP